MKDRLTVQADGPIVRSSLYKTKEVYMKKAIFMAGLISFSMAAFGSTRIEVIPRMAGNDLIVEDSKTGMDYVVDQKKSAVDAVGALKYCNGRQTEIDYVAENDGNVVVKTAKRCDP